jgi:RNA polymerase sigma-70 factor (ECF subfamily)
MQIQSAYKTDPDEELVRVAQLGDHNAFTELTRRHYGSSFKLALSILRDRSEAEDETQNAYWKAWQHLRHFHLDAKFSTWMTRIVVNQCLMRLRQTRRSKFLFLDDILMGEERGTLELLDPAQTPEARLRSQEISALVQREIRRIPAILRKVFVLRDVDQLPMNEVAGRLGISVAAAKSRLLRARSELRDRMEKYCGRFGSETLT